MTPHSISSNSTLYLGDCVEVMRSLPDNSVDSICTDPPYDLKGKSGKGGFMGKAWDGTGVAFDPETWAEALRVLKPGGHLLAFGGSRTWHRLAIAIEDAGFEIRDSIAWLYGSGFPKSLDVSKAIDKLDATEERRARALEFTAWMRSTGITRKVMADATGTASVTSHYLEEASQPSIATSDLFDMLRPHLPAVPPRIEELVRLRTVESKNFASREVTGMRTRKATGRMAQGEGGYAFGEDFADTAPATPAAEQWQGWGTALKPAFEPVVVGRKPLIGTVAANVLQWNCGALNIDGCRLSPLTDAEVARSGKSTNGGVYGDFESIDWKAEAKQHAGRWPANVALDEHMAGVLDEQSGVSKSSGSPRVNKASDSIGTFKTADRVTAGISDSGGASRFFYVAKAPKKERPVVDGVAHATVKPLALMRWLVRLVTPPGGTVLEPFAGSGTTVEACILEGFHCIAIEREAEYLPLIQARIDRQDAA